MLTATIVEKLSPVVGTIVGLGAEGERVESLLEAGRSSEAVMLVREITEEPFPVCVRICDRIRTRMRSRPASR